MRLGETVTAQARLEVVKRRPRGDLHDDVHVLGGAHLDRASPRDPQLECGAADEHDLLEQIVEGRGRALKQLDVHGSAATDGGQAARPLPP